MQRRPLPALVLALALGSVLGLGSCLPLGESPETEALRDRIDRLEEKLKETEHELTEREVASRESATLLKDRLSQLERHAAATPALDGGVQEGIARQLELTQAQMMQFQRVLNQLLELSYTGQSWIHFGLGYAGHAVARTPHGSFLVEFRAQEPTPDGKGYVVKLRIGNSTSLTVHRFKLSGHFGGPPPEAAATALGRSSAAPGGDQRDEWESSLRPFEQSYSAVLPNASWKEIDLVLPAERLADLRFIRMRMEVERASLPEATETGLGKLRFSLNSKGGLVLQTDHGAIIMAMQAHRKVEGAHEIDVRFGNPLGLTVTRCTLQGRHGPEPPKVENFPELEDYRFALSEWQQRLRPFEVDIPGELVPFTWNPKTLKFRTEDPAELAFIECQLLVRNVSLRQP